MRLLYFFSILIVAVQVASYTVIRLGYILKLVFSEGIEVAEGKESLH